MHMMGEVETGIPTHSGGYAGVLGTGEAPPLKRPHIRSLRGCFAAAETLGYHPQTLEAHAKASAATYARYIGTKL
jgi:hypothetical protein